MGLLQEMTVRYAVDNSALQTGNTQAKSSITGVGQAASDASSVISDAFSGAGQAAQSFAEISRLAAEGAAEALTGVGESADTAQEGLEELNGAGDLSTVVSGAGEADDALSTLSDETETAAESMDDLGESAGAAGAQVSSATNFNLSGISSMGGGLLGLGSQIGQTVMGFQIMSNVAQSTASSLLGPAAAAETVDSSLTNLLGSSSAATAMMAKMDTLASNSPFETLDIDQAGEQLIGFGISSQNVVSDITAMGDALGAVGRDTPAELDSVDAILGKMTTTGKVTEAQMTELGDHGINALTAIAKGAGKSTDQIKEMIKSGTLPATDAIKDLTAGIEANPMLAGGMARAAGTFSGELSTVKSNFDQVLASFGSPILKDLEPVLADIGTDLTSPGFKNFASSVGQKIADLFGSIGKAAKNVNFSQIAQDVQGLGNWFTSTLQPALEKAKPDFDQLATTVGNLANSALPPLLTAVGNLAPKVVTLSGDVSGGLATAITTITTNFNNWKPVIVSVGSILTALFIPAIIKSGVESTIASGKMAAGFIVNIVKTGAAGWASAGQLVGFIGNIAATGAQAVVTGVQLSGQLIEYVVMSGVDAVVAGAKFVGSFVAGLVTTGAQAVVTGVQLSGQLIEYVVRSGVEAVAAGGKFVAGLIGPLIETGVEAAATGAAFTAELVPGLIATSAEAITTAATAIPGLVIGFGAWTIGAGSAAIATLALDWPIALIVAGVALLIAGIVLLATHWGQVTAFVGDKMSGLGTNVHNIIGKIGDGFSAFGTLMHNIWNGVVNVVKGAINNIIGGINSFIGFIDGIQIHIPSVGVGPVQTPAFNWNGLGIPKIPKLSTGGQVGPGMFIAGDPGSAELVDAPGGATVYNHSQTASMLGQGQGETHVHIYLDGQEIAHYTADAAGAVIVKKLFGHGPVRSAA